MTEAIKVLLKAKRNEAEAMVVTSASADRIRRTASLDACPRSLKQSLPDFADRFEQRVPAGSEISDTLLPFRRAEPVYQLMRQIGFD